MTDVGMTSGWRVSRPARTSGRRGVQAAVRMQGLSGEGAFDVLTKARAIEATGRSVAHLEVGEPDFPVAPHIVDAAMRALRDGDTRYTPPAGLPELRAAIAESEAARGIPATAENVIVVPGVKPALFYAALSLIEPGDEVLVPDPGFPIYPSMTRFAGGVPVRYPLTTRDRQPDVDALAARITARTRVVILNAPHNPTGGSVDARTLDRIAELVEQHDLAVITDDVYGRITYAADREVAPSIAALPGLARRTIVVNGFSKTYAMTGWRLGFALVPAALAERITTLVVNGHTCTATFVQRAGIAALRGPQDGVRDMVRELRRRRDALVDCMRAIPGISCPTPHGAFYVFPDLSARLPEAGGSAEQFAARLLEEQGVAVLAGTAFGPGGANHLRISFAAGRPAIDRACSAIAACLDGARA
jgi:aspartate/methionine/tyrosine aminotransferase